MIIHNIPLESFVPHGQVSFNVENGELSMTTNTALNTVFLYSDTPIKSYVFLPDKYKLPFRLDMTVKMDSPALYVLIGKGHIGFATGMDNRRVTDILGGDFKPNTHHFNNDLPMNEYVDISVTYGKKAMWICIGNELRCISRRDPYIKALKKRDTPDVFENGFNFALACDKRTKLVVKSFVITEYADYEPIEPEEIITSVPHPVHLSITGKRILEECIRGLTHDLQREILQTNQYLLKDMKKTMDFTRNIAGGYPYSKISYVSPHGLSYKIFITNDTLSHQIGWISYNTKREQEKYGNTKKADYTVETLAKLSETSPEFADHIFFLMKECTGCIGANAKGCLHRRKYIYNGREKMSCDGVLQFKMFPSEFEDLRTVLKAVSDILSVMPTAQP